MREELIYKWLTFILPPLTGVITWITTRYSRKTQTLEMMQKSIDMLVEKNGELYKEVVELRIENSSLKAEQIRMQKELNDNKVALETSNTKITKLEKIISKKNKQ